MHESRFHPDGCDNCGNIAELWHHEETGEALCDPCLLLREPMNDEPGEPDNWPVALSHAANLTTMDDRTLWLFSALRLNLSEQGLAVYAEAGQDRLMDFINKAEDIYRVRRDKAAKESA